MMGGKSVGNFMQRISITYRNVGLVTGACLSELEI